MSFFSIFFSLLSSPLSEMIYIENKIITIDKENKDIYLTNRYGTFKVIEHDWLDRKENTIYKDTVTYRFLVTFATDEKTINNVNKDAKLTDFEIYVGKNTFLWGLVVILSCTLLLVIIAYIISYLFRFLDVLISNLIKHYEKNNF